MNIREMYKRKIDKIAKESFNNEQKILAKKILDTVEENIIDSVYQLISQRVKTGFVFDSAPEINHNAVSLVVENKEMFIDSNHEVSDFLEHKLIIGENYDALKNLLVTHVDPVSNKGLIDLIYIDPPYGTEKAKEEGNDYKEKIESNKFIYRDKFTRDGWLNMMNERLKLAKKLLKDDGAIFVSIDKNNQAHLKVLMDEIFGEENFIDSLTWLKKSSAKGVPPKNMIVNIHEYILAYSKTSEYKFIGRSRSLEGFSNPDNDPRGPWRNTNIKSTIKEHDDTFEIIDPKTGNKFVDTWAYSKKELKKLIKEDVLIFPKDKTGQVRRKEYYNEFTNPTIPIISHLGLFDGQSNTELVNKILPGNNFKYTKPIKLMKELISTSMNRDAILLDFFAGSGTTAQAVMELNEEDGGKRQFILVTNNENNIAKDITHERLFRVISGVGTKGEKIEWKYDEDKPSLVNNKVRVFEIEQHELTIDDTEKAQELVKVAEEQFKLLNENYLPKSKLDIYNELSSLNPIKKVE